MEEECNICFSRNINVSLSCNHKLCNHCFYEIFIQKILSRNPEEYVSFGNFFVENRENNSFNINKFYNLFENLSPLCPYCRRHITYCHLQNKEKKFYISDLIDSFMKKVFEAENMIK